MNENSEDIIDCMARMKGDGQPFALATVVRTEDATSAKAGAKALITGGDRSDIHLVALETATRCLILTGNLRPMPEVVRRAEELGVPVLLVRQNTLEVVEAEPVVKGQTATSSYKPAMMDNGIRVMVPPFVGTGERIIVDTNELTYVRRAD